MAGFWTYQEEKKKAFLHAFWVKVVRLNLGITLIVIDIWVGWSDCVVYRNTSQPECLPLCPSRWCRTRNLTQFWHDCHLKMTGFPGCTSFSSPFQCIYLFLFGLFLLVCFGCCFIVLLLGGVLFGCFVLSLVLVGFLGIFLLLVVVVFFK